MAIQNNTTNSVCESGKKEKHQANRKGIHHIIYTSNKNQVLPNEPIPNEIHI